MRLFSINQMPDCWYVSFQKYHNTLSKCFPPHRAESKISACWRRTSLFCKCIVSSIWLPQSKRCIAATVFSILTNRSRYFSCKSLASSSCWCFLFICKVFSASSHREQTPTQLCKSCSLLTERTHKCRSSHKVLYVVCYFLVIVIQNIKLPSCLQNNGLSTLCQLKSLPRAPHNKDSWIHHMHEGQDFFHDGSDWKWKKNWPSHHL